MNTNDMNYNEIITYAPILVDGLAKGLYSGIGKDLWEKIKTLFTTENEKAVLVNYEKDLSNESVALAVKNILKDKLASTELETDLLELLEATIQKHKELQIVNKSKNTILNSTINTSGGSFHIGDVNK